MAALTLRSTKGSPLTNGEVDGNFSALNTDIGTRLPSSSFSSAGIIAQLGFTPYDSANPAGYLSAITSALVTGALGFTPYSSSNPSGFITSTGSITGNAATATKLATARNINGVAFDGTAAITVADATKLPLAGGTTTGTITAAVAEALRVINDAGLISGWDATNATRAGYVQFNKAGNVVLMHEGVTGALALGGNGAIRALVSGSGVVPASDNAYQLGSSTARWSGLFATAVTATTLNATTANANIHFMNRVGTAASGILWYSNAPATNTMWVDYMANGAATAQGPLGNLTAPAGTIVGSWSKRSAIENAAGYGWTWESGLASSTAPAIVAELRASDGLFRPAGGLQLPGAKRLTFEGNPTWGAQLLVGGDGVNGVTRSDTIATVATTSGNLHLDAGTSRSVYLNYYSGTGGTVFGSGASATAASMDSSGQLWKGSTIGTGDRYATLGQFQVWSNQQLYRSNKGSGVTLGSTNTPPLMASSNDGGAAFMSFLREGAYAVNIGLDPDNVLRIGGWSAPANLLQLDMGGNLTVAGGMRTPTMLALNASLTDTTNGSTWYGIGRTSSDLFGVGGAAVQIGGYYGVAIRTSGTAVDISPSAFNVSTPLTAQRLAAGYDSGVAGSVNTNNWFRSTANSGIFFPDYGCGLRAAQGEYGTVGTFNAVGTAGAWAGYSIAGGVVFMHSQSSTGSWGIYNDYSNTWMLLSDMSGNATFTGNVTAYSDRRIKKDIAPIRGALAKLLKLCGVTFTRIDTKERGIGLIAQDVEEQFPEAVREAHTDAERTKSIKTVAYGNLVGPIVEALREIDARLTLLEAA
jgi:hypothetical protein